MRGLLKFIVSLTVAFLVMLLVRALAFTVCTINGEGQHPVLRKGDRILVNRWAYGLRTGDGRLFSYGRLLRQPVEKGDLVAFENPTDSTDSSIFICRCTALPGDTVQVNGMPVRVPSLSLCADGDYYWMEPVVTGKGKNTQGSETFGFVPEQCIIGRACMVIFNCDEQHRFASDRSFLPL